MLGKRYYYVVFYTFFKNSELHLGRANVETKLKLSFKDLESMESKFIREIDCNSLSITGFQKVRKSK